MHLLRRGQPNAENQQAVSYTHLDVYKRQESKHELDRFIDAMIQIRTEIQDVIDGKLDRADNPLKYAPHTAAQASASEWTLSLIHI